MKKPLFTPEELEELRRADEEIDNDFVQTADEIRESRQRDRQAKLDGMDDKKRKIAAQKAEYYQANKEKIAAQKAEYRKANKEKIADYQAEYRKANREKYNAYHREYQRKLREKRKSRSGRSRTETARECTHTPTIAEI